MRELKFRCWDKQDNGWIASNYLECCSKDAYKPIGTLECLYDWGNKERFVIQQYTGLKDKNGVEIYEGDIVYHTSDEFTNENFTGIVIFSEGWFMVKISDIDIRGIETENTVVIGNVFENPELLVRNEKE